MPLRALDCKEIEAAVCGAHSQWNGMNIDDFAATLAQATLSVKTFDRKERVTVEAGVAERLGDFLRGIGVKQLHHIPSSGGIEAPPLRRDDVLSIVFHIQQQLTRL